MKIKKYLTESVKKPVVIVQNNDGDWVGIYVKGKISYQGHEIEEGELIYALEKAGVLKKNSIDKVTADDDWVSKNSQLPNKLDDVVLET